MRYTVGLIESVRRLFPFIKSKCWSGLVWKNTYSISIVCPSPLGKFSLINFQPRFSASQSATRCRKCSHLHNFQWSSILFQIEIDWFASPQFSQSIWATWKLNHDWEWSRSADDASAQNGNVNWISAERSAFHIIELWLCNDFGDSDK